jgi:membrane protein
MKLLRRSFEHLKAKNGFDSAAVLSFSTLFAIVPMLTLVFSVFSLTAYFADLQQYLEQFLFEQLLPKNYEAVSAYMHQFVIDAQKLKGTSVLFLLVATIFLFREVDNRVNSIFEIKKERYFGFDVLIYLLVLVFGPLFLASFLFVSTYLSASDFFVFVPMGDILIAGLPIILSAIGLSLLYYFIPNKKITFKYALKAGFVVALFLEVLKSILLIYINYFPLYELIYGALSIILLFMLWVYFSWLLILLGASIVFCLQQKES